MPELSPLFEYISWAILILASLGLIIFSRKRYHRRIRIFLWIIFLLGVVGILLVLDKQAHEIWNKASEADWPSHRRGKSPR
jgi:type VI protein secretion system component VasF